MQHRKNNMSDKERREKMYAPKKCNLPANAFADDVIDNDVGKYYQAQTEIIMHHSTLGGHSNSNGVGRPQGEQK